MSDGTPQSGHGLQDHSDCPPAYLYDAGEPGCHLPPGSSAVCDSLSVCRTGVGDS